jgi:peptide deformylase
MIPKYEENPLLTRVMDEFDFDNPQLDIVDAISRMRIELSQSSNGYALAANQIGIKLRAFIIGQKEYINPKIIKYVGTQSSTEGCLSFPNIFIERERPARISVKFQDMSGKVHRLQYTGIKAVAFCHELDHLNGVIFTDCEYKVKNE